jgi:hypothetical protein
MTQPPGPFGDAYGRPGPYGQPPQLPQKSNLVPWLIVGGAVLLSGFGILLVVLLRGDDGKPAPQDAAANSRPISSSAATTPNGGAGTGDLPGGAQVAEEDISADQNRYAGSGDVALAWVDAMGQGEFQTAYDLSCADVQAAATTTAAGADPAWELGTYFFEQTLGGQGFTEASFDSVSYSEEADSDVASFTLQLDDGEQFPLLVYVQPDLTVCDFL